MPPKILILAEGYPMHDRSSAGLRGYTLVRILSRKYPVTYFQLPDELQEQIATPEQSAQYRRDLEELGVTVRTDNLERLLREERFDAVVIKYYYTAQRYLELVRLNQPGATLIVDSVDVHYLRLSLKAEVTNAPADFQAASAARDIELDVYRKADLVWVVTADDGKALTDADPAIRVEIVPNIHPMPDLSEALGPRDNSLVFVGIFSHEPNVDAVLFFHREVWPLLLEEVPQLKWKIVGGQPTPEVLALASAQIEVTGYVPETLPYLLTSAVSIAPLRYGAGMKGKVGEAMAAGIPVVTTSIGAQGMGLVPGSQILVADEPREFADQVIRLLKDAGLHREISRNARDFIQQNFSTDAVATRVWDIFDGLRRYPVKSWSLFSRTANRLSTHCRKQFDRHLGWRLKGTR